ncbi:hypothetical protein KC866_00425 [Patescibacteria group bacterium]|nr:hypothetical protein [Patescibacteria group bacterium]
MESLNFEKNSKDSEKSKNSQIEQPESLLTKEDKQVLEYSLHSFQEYLMNLNKEELPSVIILPETASRPIYYAIKPILEKIYHAQGLTTPQTHFLLTVRSPEREEFKYPSDKQEMLHKIADEIDNLEDVNDLSNKKRKQHELKLLNKKMEFQNESGWGVERRERFKEILDSAPPGKVLVVDDYISSYESIDQIENLRDLLPKESDMEYFILIDGRSENYKVNYNDKIHTGLHYTGNDLHDTTLWAFKGFSYGARPGVPWDSNFGTGATVEEKEAMIGVKKPNSPSGYSEKSEIIEYDKVQQIRKEMSEFGKKIAGEATFNKDLWKESLEDDLFRGFW